MIIETKRLIFREWNNKDIDFLFETFNDFDIAKNLIVPFPYTKENAIEFIKKHINERNNNYYFAIQRKNDRKIIGGTNLSINDKGELHGGIWLHRDFQGQGYGTEIWIARAKLAFDVLGAQKLVDGFFDFNERSKNMQLKIGYKIVGERYAYCPALKTEIKEIITNLKKSDFEKYYNSIDFDFKCNSNY